MSVPGPGFVSTRWSLVARSGADSPSGRAALAWLCEAYWEPLHRHARRRGLDADRAQDAVQGFFAGLIEHGGLDRASSDRGRFRTYLLACFDHALANGFDRERALKRGGAAARVPVQDLGVAEPAVAGADPDFDRDWARALLARTLQRLEAEQGDERRRTTFAALRPWLPGGEPPEGYAGVAAALGQSEGAVKVAVHRLRSRFRDLLRAEVAETVADPDRPGAVDDELRDLVAALGRPG